MESTKLAAPAGIDAQVGWEPGSEAGVRIRRLAKAILAEKLQIDAAYINVEREAPVQFGHHPRLMPVVDGRDVPLLVRTASFRSASVVAVSEPNMLVGLDIRDHQADEATIKEIRDHSHLWGESMWESASTEKLLLHWSRVQAVRQADSRGVSIRPETVRLDPPFGRAWTPERSNEFRLVDLSAHGYIITLAHGVTATD